MSNFMIGQRVIYNGVICVVCKPERKDSSYSMWVANPEKGFPHGVSESNIKPLPGGQL